MLAPYHQRAAAAADPTFQSRVRLAAKEYALAVATEDPHGANYPGRWKLAQALLSDQYPWLRVAELVVSDGVTVPGLNGGGTVEDAAVLARCKVVFDALAGPLLPPPPTPPG